MKFKVIFEDFWGRNILPVSLPSLLFYKAIIIQIKGLKICRIYSQIFSWGHIFKVNLQLGRY